MQTIDLHTYYPWHPQGSYMNLPDEMVATLDEFERKSPTYQRKAHRCKAHYSLDCGDGLEAF